MGKWNLKGTRPLFPVHAVSQSGESVLMRFVIWNRVSKETRMLSLTFLLSSLAAQTLLDSVRSRALSVKMAPYCSEKILDPEPPQAMWSYWKYNEITDSGIIFLYWSVRALSIPGAGPVPQPGEDHRSVTFLGEQLGSVLQFIYFQLLLLTHLHLVNRSPDALDSFPLPPALPSW